MTKRVVVLISGSGSNLQAIIDHAGDDYSVVGVISNRPGVKGLDRAVNAGIKAETLDHKEFESREAFDAALKGTVEAYKPDVVVLAGFMRILTPVFVEAFAGKMLNIHPSLLPKYAGLNTHQRAIDAGDSHAGCTVHFVTEALDGGPPVVQAKQAIAEGDDAAALAKKILVWEHQVFPAAVKWLCQGRLTLNGEKALLDGNDLPSTGFAFNE